MKRSIRLILTVFLLLSLVIAGSVTAHAIKTTDSRTIAIVFDNSGSMYEKGNQAWCRATYAMEVFASMLNPGDTLLIYPMHAIQVGGTEYTMQNPFRLTDSKQASQIREIYTEDAGNTPIESIDCAVEGLNGVHTGKKCLIVLTDGGTFYKNNNNLGKARTVTELNKRITDNAGENMTVMYLGIGESACMPTVDESKYFKKKLAENSEDALSSLTDMCNTIFGRDSLPANHISGSNIDFDISMSKLIVFVQGENISNLSVTDASGAPVGRLVSTQQTSYSTKGTGDKQYKNQQKYDDSLQGMMVTYADCAAGTYTLNYTGTATSKEFYYEPDADLDFVFTDTDGATVDPNALYEGDYKVSFGMKDAKTGQLISSDLLGQPEYQGSYVINNTETPFTSNGYSGEVPVTLNMDDTFRASLTTTFLGGYTITKTSADFGWPEFGIKVAPRPAGKLKLVISDGEKQYSLQNLEEGKPYIAKVSYQGTQLTGEELEKVDLKWDPDTSNAEIKQNFKDDHFELTVHYKDPAAPETTKCGACTVTIHAFYSAPGSDMAEATCPLTYFIIDDFTPLRVDLDTSNNYFLIKNLGESKPINVNLSMNGAPLTAQDFANVDLQVDCGGLECEVIPQEQSSSYLIKLKANSGVGEGDYPIHVSAKYTDHIGRVTESEDSMDITLSNTPLWLKWVIRIGILLLIILLIWIITHIRVLPSKLRKDKDNCYMSVGGKDVTENAEFEASLVGKTLKVKVGYGGNYAGINARDVAPGKESYLYKSQSKRSALINAGNVSSNIGEITYVDMGGVSFNGKDGILTAENDPQPDFRLNNNAVISLDGKLEDAGRIKNFHADVPLTFK